MSHDLALSREADLESTPDGVTRGGPVAPTRSRLRPLGPDEIVIDGGFWGERQSLNADVILAHCETWMERIGWISNFDKVADGVIGGNHAGIEFVDSEIYKLLEAMAWELGRKPEAGLGARYRALVARVAAAQDDDGYLNTSFGHPGQPPRYSNLEWGHELYCFGHLIQAAVARIRGGYSDDEIVRVARRAADHVYREFGPDGRIGICGHPEIEVALAELSRATGEARYLEMAQLFVERRGNGMLATTILFGHEYFQDDVPVRDATVLRGHAVRALYLASGALDVATETHDRQLADAIALQWKNTVSRRTYITGGMGSHHQDEAFGDDYELPADRAYSETCAGIGSVMLSWRLLLQTGESAYADLIERTLLNNILASPREDGRAFYYTNTLQQRTEGAEPSEDELSERAEASLRAPWFEVSCCPTNVARTLASVGLYFATADVDGVQLHQFGDYSVKTELPDGRLVSLRVESGYPFHGTVRVRVLADVDATITLRIPRWAQGVATASLGGTPLVADGTELAVSRHFTAGDCIELLLPMEPRVVRPHPRIDAARGTVAVERGPLVLVLESPDLPAGAGTETAEIDLSRPLVQTARGARAAVRLRVDSDDAPWPYFGDAAQTAAVAVADTGGAADAAGPDTGVAADLAGPDTGAAADLAGPDTGVAGADTGGAGHVAGAPLSEAAGLPSPSGAAGTPHAAHTMASQASVTIVDAELTPYFAWANRGPSTMRVWLPTVPS
ncbi:glycoside hydrolase family 127 protein [Subtercola endophyticus]|uniref:glycoside hydrolase family 127 protein n=1 Tax=Subtercola endophyticus TaxID=2895559 RepID=UPI001E3081E0|nr:beta-L-arabinofuranosidase domain-containing protein [Subtercola endophyticus]UFS59034.1 glycoside hydrolase family 127 protein [Subtercola endophyticus]